ncbi:MAG: cardiolipin synthase [Deltaproteobacteria bacterium]|nr:cardiolipin synthase [Deltaproteobacteria bacterium]
MAQVVLALWGAGLGLHAVLAVWANGHVLLTRREPTAAILWLIVITLVPVAGPVLYGLGGLMRVRRRHHLKGSRRAVLKERYASLALAEERRRRHLGQAPANVQLLSDAVGRISGRPLLTGNRLDLLVNGEQAYPRMLEAIESATATVHLFSYIYDEDEVGRQFTAALAAAARRGVEVRLLVDAVGAHDTDDDLFQDARTAGAKVARFRPLRLTRWRRGLHFRNHRKILVVDGLLGFTGGMNISERYLADRHANPARCRDFQVRVEGPVVGQLQEVFMEDWFDATGEELLADRYYPPASAAGDALCRVVTSSPVGESERIQAIFFQALCCARERLEIMTPYFIPDSGTLAGLRGAVQRGVHVDVLLPGMGDSPFVQRAALGTLPEVMSWGVNVFLRQPPFIHAKALVLDRAWAMVGSANWDARSFRFNDECNLEVIDPAFAAALESAMAAERGASRRYSVDEWHARPLGARLSERMAALFGPTL